MFSVCFHRGGGTLAGKILEEMELLARLKTFLAKCSCTVKLDLILKSCQVSAGFLSSFNF